MFDFIHAYLIGASGTGKSTQLKKIAIEKMIAGDGVLFIDPLGHNAYDLLQYVPRRRQGEVIYIDLAMGNFSWNPLYGAQHPEKAADSITRAFNRATLSNYPTPEIDIILKNSVLLVLQNGGTLTGVLKFMLDKEYRFKTFNQVDSYAADELKQYLQSKRPVDDLFGSSIRRVKKLLDSPECRNIFQVPVGKFHMDEAIDAKKIIILNGAQGAIGEEPSRLFISIFLDLFHTSCMRRPLPHHYTVITDEFWMYTTDVVARALSHIRNYNVSFVLAHQYTQQVEKEIMAAILANTDTKYVFGCSYEDGRILAPEFKDRRVTAERLADLPRFEAMVMQGDWTQVKFDGLSPGSEKRRSFILNRMPPRLR